MPPCGSNGQSRNSVSAPWAQGIPQVHFFTMVYLNMFFIAHQNLLELPLKRLKALPAELDIPAVSEAVGFTITVRHITCIYIIYFYIF